jgi:hypothetical protein
MAKIQIENFASPGHTYNVDATKYEAMREAYLAVIPAVPPGLTPVEIRTKLTPLLPDQLFPGGAKAGWWAKAVQLDLEAKGVIARGKGGPVRLFKA